MGLNQNAAANSMAFQDVDPLLQTEVDLLLMLAEFPEISDVVRDNITVEYISSSIVGRLLKCFLLESQPITIGTIKDTIADPTLCMNLSGRYNTADSIYKIINNLVMSYKMRYTRETLPLKLAKTKDLIEAEDLVSKSLQVLSIGRIDNRTMDKSRYMDQFIAYQRDKVPGWKCGIPAIDRQMNGNFKTKQVVVISAETSVGKTMLAYQIVLNMVINNHASAAMFCLEMPTLDTLNRMVPQFAQSVRSVDLEEKCLTEPQMQECIAAIQYIQSLNLQIIDNEFDINQIKYKIRLLSKQGVKLFLIDYLQLAMKDPGSVKEVEEITRDLKRLAMSHDVMIILVAQFHRKDDIKMYKEVIVKRKPMLSDLKGGSAIECNADKVMFLHYDPEWGGNYLASSHVEFLMAKNRQGPGSFNNIFLELDKMKCYFKPTTWVPPKREGK